jgi:hypothetical protein
MNREAELARLKIEIIAENIEEELAKTNGEMFGGCLAAFLGLLASAYFSFVLIRGYLFDENHFSGGRPLAFSILLLASLCVFALGCGIWLSARRAKRKIQQERSSA